MNTEAQIAYHPSEMPGFPGMASKLLANGFDVGCLRPYIAEDRHVYYTLNAHLPEHQQTLVRVSKEPVMIPGIDTNPFTTSSMGMFSPLLQNARKEGDGPLILNTPANLISGTAGALLTREEFETVQTEVLQVALPELTVWNRLRQAVPKNLPNGMSQIMMTWVAETDAGNATMSMSPLRQAGRDRPTRDRRTAPVPIVHADGSFDIRELAVSRRNGEGLDTEMIRKSARKVAELVEQFTVGTLSSFAYGGGTLYGLRNFPDRVTAAFTIPTDPAWTPETLVNELLAAVDTLKQNFFRGPFLALYSPNWFRFFQADYSSVYSTGNVMNRVNQINQIVDWQEAYYLTGYQIILIQLDPAVIQAVSGMDLTTVQYEEAGGFEVIFKILAIMFPLIRSDARGLTGVLHATAA